MLTIAYELQGGTVPESMRGKVINLRVAESLAEAASLCVDGEAGVVDKFNDGNVIRIQGRLRDKAAAALKTANGNPDAAITALQEFASTSQYVTRKEGEGVARGPKTAKGKQQAVAATSGNRLFEKCLGDEQFLARMEKQGIVDRAEFDAW